MNRKILGILAACLAIASLAVGFFGHLDLPDTSTAAAPAPQIVIAADDMTGVLDALDLKPVEIAHE